MVQIETCHTIFGCNNSENDGCVTVRDRDTMEQEHVKISICMGRPAAVISAWEDGQTVTVALTGDVCPWRAEHCV